MPSTSERAGPPLEVFYSYAHKDEALREELEMHLSVLRRQGHISGWHDRNINAGIEWAQEIDEHLNIAQIILLLISADFLASDYCYSVEMQRALQRHEAREARVIPIIRRPVSWEGAPFSKLQMLPRDSIPIISKQWENRDEAWTHVVQELRKVIARLQTTILAPSSAPAPRIWHVPYRRNPLFTGREDLLQQIHDRFMAPNSGNAVALSQSQAISGLGGIGKTQTALEYAYRYRKKYRAVLWVGAASEETLQTDMIKLASVLGVTAHSGSNEQEAQRLLATVKAWLTEQRDWLLILDNADDLAMAHAYLPEDDNYNGHILLTTRAQAGGSLIRMVPVESMSREEGALLLLRRAKVLTPETTLEHASARARAEAEAIVTELGGLPLAIDQAGAYIEETGSSLSGYLDLYWVRRKELLQRRSVFPSHHPEPVATTWSLSFRRLEEVNPAAADLLRLCAFLDPDAIAEIMLIEGGTHLGPVLKPVMADPLALNQAIEELRKFSLVRRNAESGLLSLHRLVQVVLKDGMEKKAQRQWAKRTVLLVHATFPQVEFATWERCRQYLPHTLACAALIETHRFTFANAADLLDSAGWYLREQALYEQAELLFQQALAIEERLGDDGQNLLADTLNNLVLLYREQGKYGQALPLGQRALSIREQISGPNHPNTATTLDNLAQLYRSRGKLEQAEPLYQRALAIREQGLGSIHPDTAITLDNLAQLYREQRKYEQAEPLYQRALAIREQQLGPNHPDTAVTLQNLAYLYYSQEKYEQAEPLYQRALAIREQQLGPNHPSAAISLNTLALLYRRQGKFEQAEPLLQRALAINEQRLGPTHPDTAITLNNLAFLYQSQGKLEQAEPLYQCALAIREQRLGPEHPEVATDLEDYATLLRDMKRYEEAAALTKRAQAIRVKQLSQ